MLLPMENPMRRWFASLALMLVWAQAATAGTILVVGDSISAGFGLDTGRGWVSRLDARLHEQGLDHQVVNASISGDTTSGGLTRLPALLERHRPQLVVIELGGNDGLRGQPPALMQKNLQTMVEASRRSGAKVLLLGMQLPPNYGERYTRAFAKVFEDVAVAADVALVPFFLEGIGGVPGMMQSDGIHPAEAAQTRLLDNAWPAIKPLL
jgi:acyl-CoA thioesterase-1